MMSEQVQFFLHWKQHGLNVVNAKIDSKPTPRGLGRIMGYGIVVTIPYTPENEETLEQDSFRDIAGYHRVDWRKFRGDDALPFQFPVIRIQYLKESDPS